MGQFQLYGVLFLLPLPVEVCFFYLNYLKTCSIILPLYDLVDWIESHQFPCFYKHVFGFSCPLCGAQRGFLLLMKGHFSAAFVRFPLFIIWTITVAILCVCKSIGKLSQTIINTLMWGNLVFLILNAVYQNIYG